MKKLILIIILIGYSFGSNTSVVSQNIDISGQWFLAFNNASEIKNHISFGNMIRLNAVATSIKAPTI